MMHHTVFGGVCRLPLLAVGTLSGVVGGPSGGWCGAIRNMRCWDTVFFSCGTPGHCELASWDAAVVLCCSDAVCAGVLS